MRLCLFYMRELRDHFSLSASSESGSGGAKRRDSNFRGSSNKDVEAFLFGERGNGVLAVLERSYRQSSGEGRGDGGVWWNSEFVDLLIHLYQLSPPPGAEKTCPRGEEDPGVITANYDSCRLADLIDLWSYVKAVYSPKTKKRRTKNSLRAGAGKLTRRSSRSSPEHVFPNFPPPPSTLSERQGRMTPSDLHHLEETVSSSLDDDDDDDERSEQGGGGRRDGVPDLKAYPPNPLDFAFFERPMRSEDEAKFMIDWARRRERPGPPARGREAAPEEESETVDNAEEEVEVDVDAELMLLQEEEVGPESSVDGGCGAGLYRFSEARRKSMLLSLLVSVYKGQVRSRRLRVTYELSLKLAAFASDSLRGLQRDRIVSVDDDDDGREEQGDDDETLCLKMHLCQLLLASVTETQFHSDYVATLQRNKVLELCTAVIGEATEAVDKKSALELKKNVRCILDLVSLGMN